MNTLTQKTTLAMITSLTLMVTVPVSAALVGLWEFENSGDLSEATVGSALTLNGTITSTSGVGGADTGAGNVGVGDTIRATNPIGGNGGGTQSNEYTIVMDIQIPTLVAWASLMDQQDGGDGDYFYSSTRGLGVSSEGYVDDSDPPSTISAGTWHRLVLSIDNGTVRKTYVDGVDASTIQGAHGNGSVDGRWSLGGTVDFFDDNGGGEEATTLVSNLALFDTALSAAEVTALGAVGTAIAVPEPSSTALLGLGGFTLILRRRKK